jgi:hypothetical protein
MSMNAQVLNNPLAQFWHNEQKVIVKAKRHTFLEWDRLQVDLQYTPEVPKPALVRLTSNHILRLLGMSTLGVGVMLLNVQTMLEHDENLALVIRITQAEFAKALKGA